ncbi:MAG: 2-oxo acid dehydrogenase subunit E2 [Clostridia bacterium]|nr:2-oxo acid dehydrogenase subunit E2 [Clostridia bacterium]
MEIIKTEHFDLARKIVSHMTSESWHTIPHVCVTYEHEASEFINVLKELNRERTPDGKITLNTAMLKVITEGLKACPAMNGHIDFNEKLVRGTVTLFKNIDISMPTILEDGRMMTINMHSMEEKNLTEMTEAVKNSLERACNSDMNEVMMDALVDNSINEIKKGKLGEIFYRLIGSKTGKYKIHSLSGAAKKEYYRIPERFRLTKHDIEQGTVTVSNLGSIYRDWHGDCAILEIIPPQIAAIGIGALQSKAVVDNENKVCAGKVIPITIAFDHRALDMGDVVPFMKKLDSIFENPQILKKWA